nr:uncharacterized protein LOC121823575 [Peromyscus maniculatus bairdii]
MGHLKKKDKSSRKRCPKKKTAADSVQEEGKKHLLRPLVLGKSPGCQEPNDNGVLPGSALAQEPSSLQAGSRWVARSTLPCTLTKTHHLGCAGPTSKHQSIWVLHLPGSRRPRSKGALLSPLTAPGTLAAKTQLKKLSPGSKRSPVVTRHTGWPTHTQTESATILQLQEPPELRLQTLLARLKGTQAKKPGGRQTKMVAFQAQAPSPGQQAESGAAGASSSEMSSLQEASAQGPPRRAPCLLPPPPPRPASNKPQPKKRPAQLMAKALRDYKKKLSQR